MNEVYPSLSDIAAVTGNRSNGGFGGDNAIWLIVILAVILMAGRNGGGLFGGNGGNGTPIIMTPNNGSGSVADNYVLVSDFAQLSRQLEGATNSIERKGDYIQEQICNSDNMRANQVATLQASLMNGFAGVNQGISNNRYETQLAVNGAQTGITGAITNLGSQVQNCCCEARYNALQNTNAIQGDINGLNTSLLMGNNALQNAINNGFCTNGYNMQTSTRDIIDNQNANTRAILDSLTQSKLEAKNERISELENMLNNANLRASQLAQTNAIDNKIEALGDRLQPTPVPAFPVPNPFNYNNGCGCGNYNF